MLADRKGSRSGLVPLRVTKVTGVSDFLAITHAMTYEESQPTVTQVTCPPNLTSL
jgi:hypothetical protein